MKALIKSAAALPWRILPAALRRRAIQAGMHAAAAREPRAALRELLQIETDLDGAINETALRFGDGVHVKHRLMHYHDFFVDRIRAGERVLDVGCGYGAVAYSIATRAEASVIGIDMNADNVRDACARFQHPSLCFLHGVAPQDVPDERFDVVVASNVLEHVERRRDFLTAIQRRTRATRWLIRVPMETRDWRVPLRNELGLRSFSDPTHFIEYTRETFASEVADAGFFIRHLQVNWGEIWAEVTPGA